MGGLGWLAVLSGCVDPFDVVGVEEIVTEQRHDDPLADDRLEDKRPVWDEGRLVEEEFSGCLVTLNKSDSVTRLTLQASGAEDNQLRGRIFPNRRAALGALSGKPTLPSIEVVNGALKPFNDGLYAAVELRAESGEASTVNKRELLRELLNELVDRASNGADVEKPHARTAAEHVATALALGGDAASIPADLAEEATQRATEFRGSPLFAKPIGFYAWNEDLEAIFTRDRWLQRQYIPGVTVDPPFAAFAELALVVGRGDALSDAYAGVLDLYAGLTDPFFDASPFELAAFVPDAGALADLGAVESAFAATRPPSFPDFPFCNPGVAALPASESADNRMMRLLLCNHELLEGENLLDGLIRKIQIGELDLTPRADSGWYDHQLYALETLLVPEKGAESEHLLLTRAYKEKLVETFKSLLIQTRETHVKQVAMVSAGPTSAPSEPIPFSIHPRLVVEPFPTFYLRTARAYRFVEGVLASALGTEFLDDTSRLTEDGTRSTLTLGEELHEKQMLLYGLHALSADSIGMAPELVEDELSGFPLDEARALARAWLASVMDDADVARDPRVSLPVAIETVGGRDFAIYWAVVGVKVLHLHASFPESRRPTVVSVPWQCVHDGWEPFEPYMLVEQTIQVRRPVEASPLDREEFRALCDAHDNVDDIRAAFESAP